MLIGWRSASVNRGPKRAAELRMDCASLADEATSAAIETANAKKRPTNLQIICL